ncbi:restriction endonuclease subunit S domain-containing protein [Roseiconus lacunae]|uniref:hypothetical protein n=1 Tax=Roseiconus lacunae TaxID=2605694 RepID=UPI001E2F3D9E|nr:hypothetical protein [Roseiconus lacunae]
MFGDPAAKTPSHQLRKLGTVFRQPLQNCVYYPKDKYSADAGTEKVHMSDAFYVNLERGNFKRVAADAKDITKYQLTSSDLLVARRSLTIEGAAKPFMTPEANEPLIYESSFIHVSPDPEFLSPLHLFHFP